MVLLIVASATLSFLVGIVLGARFRAFVLLLASVVILLLGVVAAIVDGNWREPIWAALAALIAVQAGYFVAVLFRARPSEQSSAEHAGAKAIIRRVTHRG